MPCRALVQVFKSFVWCSMPLTGEEPSERRKQSVVACSRKSPQTGAEQICRVGVGVGVRACLCAMY